MRDTRDVRRGDDRLNERRDRYPDSRGDRDRGRNEDFRHIRPDDRDRRVDRHASNGDVANDYSRRDDGAWAADVCVHIIYI